MSRYGAVVHNCGARVRLIRMAHGMNKKAFADALGVSPSHVTSMEKPQGGNPSRILAQNIANKFDVTFDWLLSGFGWMYYPPSSAEAIAWLVRQLYGQRVQRVIIVTYVPTGTTIQHKGFLLEVPEGVLSMAGNWTEAKDKGFLSVGSHTYFVILNAIKQRGVPAGHVVLTQEQHASLETLDLSSLVLGATSTEQVLDRELSRLPYEELMRLPPGERAEFLGVDSAVRDNLKEELTEAERIYSLLCDAAPETHALVVRILEETDAETTALIGRLLDARHQIKEVTAALLRPT